MKAFLFALLFFVATAAVAGIVFNTVTYTATEVYSLSSARVGEDGSVEHNPVFVGRD